MIKHLKMLFCFLVACVCALTVMVTSGTATAVDAAPKKWVAAWGTAPAKINMNGMSAIGSLVGDITVRVVINPTANGEKFRIKVSNYYGDTELKIKGITAAYSKGASKIDENNLKIVTFNDGSPDVKVKPGDEVYSDPISLAVRVDQPIALSIFINEYQDVGTMGLSGATTYFTTGDATRVLDYDLLKNVFDEQEMLDVVSKLLEGFIGTGSIDLKLAYSFMKFVPAVTSIDVLTDASSYSVVVAGDSTVANDFPEYLAQAIRQKENVENVGVVGKGLVGNMLMSSGLGLGTALDGDSLVSRLGRDVLEQSGVEYVIIKIGANDIIHPVSTDFLTMYPDIRQPTAQDIINGYKKVFDICHDAGIKVVVASITQWKGYTRNYFDSGAQYYRTEAEIQKDWQIAKEVNAWLASTDEHDGFVNLTDISANPISPDEMQTEYTLDCMNPTEIGQRLWANYFPLYSIGIGNKPSGVKLDNTSISLYTGKKKTLVATVTPETAVNKNLIWESSAPAIASVDKNGVVTAKSNGTAIISCKTEIGGYKASCTVKVTTKPESVKLSYSSYDIYTTQVKKLEALIQPETTSDKSVTWSSSNTKVAVVDKNGNVTGVGAGTAVITAKTNVGGLTATCTINVTKKTEVQSITLKFNGDPITSKTLYTNGVSTATFTYSVLPTNATFKDITWSSTNPAVATVDPLGNVKAISAGKTVIRCTSDDNPMVVGSCTVTVKVKETGIKLDKSSFEVYETKSKTLKATVSPVDATNKNVTWTSSNTSVATVDKDGKVTGKKAGTAYISATTANGKYTAKAKVTVLKMIYTEKVVLNKTTLTLNDGATFDLNATVLPENAITKTVKWSSSDKKIVKVDSYGEVTAVAPGTAYIYCTTTDNGTTAKCKVTVKAVKPTSVSLSVKTLTLDYNKTYQLTAKVLPTNASDKTVKWTSSNPKVVSVTSAGKVKALKAGESAVITVTTNSGKCTAKVTVKVNPIPVSKITLNKTSATMTKGDTLTLKATIAPSNATNKTLKWSSSDTNIVKVSSSGKVTAIKNGTATITCKSADGKKVTCKITVKDIAVTSIKLDKTNVLANKGVVFVIKATVSPSNATNKTVKWSTSDKSVATVDSKGKVTVVGYGECEIIAKSHDGKVKATCKIKVV